MRGPRTGRPQRLSLASPLGACAHLFSTLRILWRMPAREEADRLPPPLPSAGREPGQAAPAREAVPPAKRRSGEAPAAPAAASQRTALGLLPSPGRTPPAPGRRFLPPGLFASCDPSPGTPRQVAAKGVAGNPELRGSTARTVQREEPGCQASPSVPVPRACPGDGSCGGAASAGAGFAPWESCRLCLTE
ncbi:hypothetical protein NN561_017772 [Cricetulus griseus]